MSTNSFAWEQQVFVQLPGHTKKTPAIQRSIESLPTIPLIVNKKPIEKHTQLVLYLKDTKKKKCLLAMAIGKGGPSASR